MIVRLMGEGQVELDDAVVAQLQELDEQLEQAVDAEDETAFRAALTGIVDLVHRTGRPLPPDTIVESDFILPPADAHVADVRALLTDDGLVPD